MEMKRPMETARKTEGREDEQNGEEEDGKKKKMREGGGGTRTAEVK